MATTIVPITVEYVSGIIIPKDAAPKMIRSTIFKFVEKYPSIAALKPNIPTIAIKETNIIEQMQ